MNLENEDSVDGINTDNQDDFDAEFYGTTKTPDDPVEENDDNSDPEEENSEEQSDDNIDADDDTADDDTGATEDDGDDSDPEEEAPKPQGKKKSVQERINELTAARREAERRADEAERLYRESQSRREQEEAPEPDKTETEATAPNPSDREKYPLGDLDPNYQQDMLDYKLDARLKELDAKREQKEQETIQKTRLEAVQAEWNAKLEAAEGEYENYRETVENLQDTFKGVQPEYGQFIAETIMSMDKGPDILYHLATNPDVAEAIVRGTPVNAALALGKLEASFSNAPEPAPKKTTRTSTAPKPPSSVNKGNAPRFAVKPDTDDLDAFSDAFYKD